MKSIKKIIYSGDKVRKLSFVAGDRERNQERVVERTTYNGLVIIKWDNGSVYNTYVSPDNLEKIYM